ncbi:MAG: hypothetical protein QHJ73_08200, partial [Armatimonadota bacterium]|nr:hypothetical protein [Armatimonadota bacterium]
MGNTSAERERAHAALEELRRALGAHHWGCDWRVAVQPPADPAGARPDTTGWPGWQEWFVQGSDWKPGEAWLYAALTLPEAVEGVRLSGSTAHLHLHGWHPFRLYLDGQLLAQEERPWLATGPALLPLPEPVEAGRTYQVALCLSMPEWGITVPFGAALRVETLARAIEEVEALQAELQIAVELAESETDQEALTRAYASLDVEALQRRDWERVRASFAAVESALQPFASRAKAHTIHLIGHSHIDMNWLWTWPDTVACVLRDFHSVAELMRDYPELTFTHS